MLTFTKVGNSVKVEVDTDVYYLTTDKIVYTRASENKIYIQNEAAPNIKSYISFKPTDVNGRPNDDLLDVAQFLIDDYFTGLSMSALGGGGTLDDGSNAAIKASVLDYTNSNPLAVRLTDTNGDYIAAGAGTQYTEGDTDASITGTALLWEGSGNTLKTVSSATPLPVNILSNQADEYGFQTTTNLLSAGVYNSGILALSPEFSQVQTHIRADQNGTINIYWYSDSGGTDQIRILSISYASSDGFQMFAAPAFSPYVRYTFTNTGSNQSDFYFDTKFLTKSINGQILTVGGPISAAMVANLGRNVIVGESSSGGGSFVNVKVNPSGTLETNANIAAGTNYIGKTRLTDGTTDAEVVPLTGYNAQAVAIVDGSGTQITSFGGGTQYTEGDVDATITGTALMMESAGNTLVTAQGTTSDGLLVNLGANNDVSISNTVTVQATDLDVRNLVFATDKVDASGTVLGAGNNNIGDVDIASIAAGTNYIGKVRLTDGTNDIPVDTTYADAESNTANHHNVHARQSIFNGTDWDRVRSSSAVNASTTASETGIQATGVGPGFSRIDSSQTITANAQSRTFNTKGTAQLGITISGTWSGTLVVEFTNDDSTWDTDEGGFNYATYRVATGTITSNVTLYFDSSATSQYRVRSTAWTSGTANIKFVGDINGAISVMDVINSRPDRIGVDHVWKSANYTTTQTGTAMWTPASGAKINLMHLAVSSYGTTAARVIIWYGAGGDTTYTAGTDQLVWAGSFAPSTTAKPGMISNFTIPVRATTADHVLRITTDAAISLDISMYGYETLTE